MPRKTKSKPTSARMDAPSFVREFGRRQLVLLNEMAAAIKRGEVSLDDSERSDRFIETVVADWCSQAEPDMDSHMSMLGAVFLWALLDKAFPQNENSGPTQRQPVELNELVIEALKTVRSIWGKNG